MNWLFKLHKTQPIARAVGNSLKELNETHLIPFFIGIALGTLPITLPGLPQPVKLGLAGACVTVLPLLLVGIFARVLCGR
jgi:putative transport protein